MKVGDLVKYRAYHSTLKDVRGIVCEIRYKYGYGGAPERARVIWNHDRVQWDGVMDWVDDLEIINESR
tara:strand:+ start:36185 stop:36388 length:204 start_codon:yes stop_codon:yes gene_type:complete